ncbi:MAG: NAD(P)-dependent oxidoreductase [Lachnospiraceae bacterium]|nr:NAD(P)-dependent oxidoreductase [Lachnospiraceae bacterium]
MKKAVITGATGVVGTALVRELHRCGTDQLILIRGDSPNAARLLALRDSLEQSGMPGGGKIEIRSCALDELKSFEYDSDEKWDAFFHLGWSGTKGKERYDPYIHTQNVTYSLDAVALAARMGCTVFVGAGSQAEYGRSDERLTADTLTRPESAYGIAKLCAGAMTREYARTLGIRHIWPRIVSVFGPCDGEKTLITSLINELREGRRPKVTAGEQLWDFLSSADAARALISLAERGQDGKVYIIASGRERVLRSYIEELRDEAAPGAEIGFGEVPYGDRQVMHLAADISETTKDTGWKPELSFREGIRLML